MRRKRIVIVIILGILTVLIIAIAIFRSHNNSTRSYTKQDIISLGPQRKPHVISEIKWSITDQRLYKKKYLNDADAKEMLYSHYYGIVQNKLVIKYAFRELPSVVDAPTVEEIRTEVNALLDRERTGMVISDLKIIVSELK